MAKEVQKQSKPEANKVSPFVAESVDVAKHATATKKDVITNAVRTTEYFDYYLNRIAKAKTHAELQSIGDAFAKAYDHGYIDLVEESRLTLIASITDISIHWKEKAIRNEILKENYTK